MTNILFVFSFKPQNTEHLIITFYDSIAMLMKSWLLRFALDLLMELERVQGGTSFHAFLYDMISLVFSPYHQYLLHNFKLLL